MEGNLSSGNMIPGGSSNGGLDLQGSMQVPHQQHPLTLQPHHSLPRQGSMVHPSIHENFPLPLSSMQDCDQTISLEDSLKGERGKISATDEDEPSFMEDAIDAHNDANRGKTGIPWQHVNWTDKMVRLLITAVSYIGEDSATEYGKRTRGKHANLQKKGNWKLVSEVMAERGHYVSPQQSEDKFSDLNRRYKRLNEILGRGTSCQVVERPKLLDMMDYLSEKAKEEVRKILSSKHLFYQEMCSYNNGNRLHLPHDPELRRSLRLALKGRDDRENKHLQDDLDEGDQDAETDDHDEFEENYAVRGDCRAIYEVHEGSAKRMKQCQGHEDIHLGNSLNSLNCTFNFLLQNAQADMNQVLKHRSLQLEEQKLQIQAQMLELEKERFKWQKFCRKGNWELEMMRIVNERMKLDNMHMELDLKRKEMDAKLTLTK
ncbi:hypothetical protein ACSBR2_001118 [Camellia fascicularis]